MKIAIITGFPFPKGYAGTNRLLSYAIGLSNLNHSVMVYIINPTENTNCINNYNRIGSINRVSFEYTVKEINWPTNTLKKIYLTIQGYVKFCFRFISLNNKQYDIVISTFDSLYYNIFLYPVITYKSKVKILIVDEYPKPLRQNRLPNWYQNKLIVLNAKLFDSIIVMTTKLLEFYSRIKNKEAKIHHMLMTVDLDRFNNLFVKKHKPYSFKYIAYVGSMSAEKDGLYELMQSFSKVVIKHPHLYLLIIGGGNKLQVNELNKLVEKNGIQGKVVLTGYIAPELVPELLESAELLVLSRDNSLRAEAGFPTKLGEYLATGKPVVTTNVGDIPLYIKNEMNGYLVKPGDIQEFANTIIKVIENPDKAKAVGFAGRELAEKLFDSKVQSLELEKFLKKVLKVDF